MSDFLTVYKDNNGPLNATQMLSGLGASVSEDTHKR